MAVILSVNGRREKIEAGQTLTEVLEGKRVRPEVSMVFLNRERVRLITMPAGSIPTISSRPWREI